MSRHLSILLLFVFACSSPTEDESDSKPVDEPLANHQRSEGEKKVANEEVLDSEINEEEAPEDLMLGKDAANEGTIGLDSLGTIGHGAGGGVGSSYGFGGLGLRGTGRGGGGDTVGLLGLRGCGGLCPKLPTENAWTSPNKAPLSTFGADVDTASYALARRTILKQKWIPDAVSVRAEEFINYMHYDFAGPKGPEPLRIEAQLGRAPWNEEHYLLGIALQAKAEDPANVPARNLTFLIDVSGSMDSEEKLGLVKHGLTKLVEHLRPQDRVAIVVYAGAAGLVLRPTSGDKKKRILSSLKRLDAGGSTAGGAGIKLAYKVASQHFEPGSINRIIIATDGDFNVGVSSRVGLKKLIEKKRESGIFLSVLGVGSGYRDEVMETLADHGNGNYAFLDGEKEAERVLVHEIGGSLNTVAKDVKIQVEFNPRYVSEYKLVGYENRVLATEDFDDDKKDSGDVGAGQNVVAFYEIKPAAAASNKKKLRYQQTEISELPEVATVRFRYKLPNASESRLSDAISIAANSAPRFSDSRFAFAAKVAEFALLIRNRGANNSAHRALSAFDKSLERIENHGVRLEEFDEFRQLVKKSVSNTRPRIQPKVRLPKVVVEGGLSEDVVRRILRRHINEARHCYDQALKEESNAAGQLRASIFVDESGKPQVTSIDHESDGTRLLDRCMQRMALRLWFPERSVETMITVDFRFYTEN